MRTELVKRTVEITNQNGEEIEKVIQVEYSIKKENDVLGTINVNQHGVNFNLNTGDLNVEEISDLLTNYFNEQ